MKKVIFSLSSACLMFLGHAQVNSTFKPDNTLGKDAIIIDASFPFCALSTSADRGYSISTGANQCLIHEKTSSGDENSCKTYESKRLFEKTIYVEIDRQKDSTLFIPYSKAWNDSWRLTGADISCNGSEVMNAYDYNFAFNQRSGNLWTLLHPELINGTIMLYSPYDPNLFGLSGYDDGELRYPIKGKGPSDNFLNSQELRDEMCFYLGQFGPQSSVLLVTKYGEDSIVSHADGTQSFAYPPPDYMWYRDTDIIKYKVRVRVIVKKNGEEKKRIIEAIAPMIYETDEGQITGERELLWLDYNEVKPCLKEGYFLNEFGKPVTYLKYFEKKVKGGA